MYHSVSDEFLIYSKMCSMKDFCTSNVNLVSEVTMLSPIILNVYTVHMAVLYSNCNR